MRKLIIFSTLLLLSAVVGCMPKSSEDGHLYIISTNDVHATIDALPRLATLVAVYEERGEVLLVDSGDRVSGNAYVDDAAEPGVPLIEIMNDMGYDVATLGNHEFDKGSQVLDAMIDAAEFDVVCANVTAKSGAKQPLHYTVIEKMGVEIRCGVEVGKDVTIQELRDQGYKAFYIAIGCQGSRKAGVEGEDAEGVISAVDHLYNVHALGDKMKVGKKVVIVGGGNVAVDAARTSARLGGEDVQMFCLESRETMPASDEEVEETLAENIAINNGWGPKEFLKDENGKAYAYRDAAGNYYELNFGLGY